LKWIKFFYRKKKEIKLSFHAANLLRAGQWEREHRGSLKIMNFFVNILISLFCLHKIYFQKSSKHQTKTVIIDRQYS